MCLNFKNTYTELIYDPQLCIYISTCNKFVVNVKFIITYETKVIIYETNL